MHGLTRSLGLFSRRPAVSAAVLLIFGILLHDLAPAHPARLLIASFGIACLVAMRLRWRVASTALLCGLIISLGIGLAQREHFHFASNDICFFATDEPHLAEIEARLVDDPQIVAGPAGANRLLPPKQTAMAEVLRIKTWNGWIDATGRMPVQINEPNPELMGGQTVRMLGMLQRPRKAMNPGEFDWEAYYRQQRILATFAVRRVGNIQMIAPAGFDCIRWIRNKSRHLLAAGFTAAHADEWALLDALVLGNHDPELRDIQDEFKQTGMGYQLRVSGLHIALLTAVVFCFCRQVRCRPRVTLLTTTAFCLIYSTLSLPSHSGVRAAILCIVITVATLSRRSTDRLQLLSLAVIAMLLWHPLDLYSAGFHLSLAVAIAFLFLLARLTAYFESRRDVDDLAKPTLRQPTFFQRLLVRIGQMFLLSWVAWLATLPLVAYHFGAASTWSILGSLILFPVVALALFGGVAKILATLLWPRLAEWWASIFGSPVRWLEWGVHHLGRLPGSSIQLPTPAVWLVILYYLLLFAPLLPYGTFFSGRRRWVLRLAPLAGVAAIFSLLIHWHAPHPADGLRVTLLSLGAGQCAVVEVPGGQTVLIDAGSTTVPDVATKLIMPFLRSEGRSQVDEIFLSHGDFDHISAAGEIATAYNVHDVFTSHHFVRNSAGNVPDQNLLDELDKLNRTPKEIAIGEHYDLGGGAMVEVLWPPKDGLWNSNNAGLVLRLTYAGRSILFPADIQDPAFAGVLKQAAALKSDVLVAPHHGSSEDLTPAFLTAVHPQTILSSNFWRLTGKQKRFEKMIGRTPLYRTPQCGAITVTIGRDGNIAIQTFVKPTQ